jgi:gamma-glutamyltranspeptidase / glutathione hydrolase
MPGGIVAAGHHVTAAAGARVLAEGGNAVDAAIAAMLASWAAEPLLTGPGAGGYLLVAGPGWEPTLLDFFVAAPGFGFSGERAPLVEVLVDFDGETEQAFHVGAASCGTYGSPAGAQAAIERWGSVPLADLAAPAAELARAGVEVTPVQAHLFHILAGIPLSSPEGAATFVPGGRPPQVGETLALPELGDAIERLGRDGAAPFYTGDIAAAIVEWVRERGGLLTAEDLAAYQAIPREPARVGYRGHQVITNPPPSAGGTLLALSLGLLDREPGPPSLRAIVDAMAAAQDARTDAFLDGLAEPGFLGRFLGSRLGSTTHISAIDAEGRAASVTCTNGEGSGLVVPGTGVHVNNIMGEEDLSPLGFHTAPPGRRMPSMMAPTAVLRGGEVELVVGSAGSNRIRSALLQTIVGVVDHGLDARAVVEAPRVHFEHDRVYAEPGVPVEELEGREVVAFRARNLFFGGVQAVVRDPVTGELTGAGDPRRGGAVAAAS